MIRVPQPSHGVAWQRRKYTKNPYRFSWGYMQHRPGGFTESKTKWLDHMRLVLRPPSSSAANSGIVKPPPYVDVGRRCIERYKEARI
jgi:hypothetical protein